MYTNGYNSFSCFGWTLKVKKKKKIKKIKKSKKIKEFDSFDYLITRESIRGADSKGG